MSNSQYIFTDTQHRQELERLQAIERVFDPASHRRIQSTGITENWRCLEVGAGAGSIARSLATLVGNTGKVLAIDLDTRFLGNLNESNLEILEADIRQLQRDEASFDLIHARYVLIHLVDWDVALNRMLALLKPGGWFVLEEPDFASAKAIAGEPAACDAVSRVNQSILKMFSDRGMTYDLGAKLPSVLQKLELQLQSVENDAPIANGGSGIAAVMKQSTQQLAAKYVATGIATLDDIQHYCQFADDSSAWAIYYATVGVVAQKAIDDDNC
jgi:2-polyprenyl-3-methyl-5-hydroxy-6-metoxy-1,4-benzoquinol methylase